MQSSVYWDPTGRPWAQCPRCGKHHPINRRKDKLDKPRLRFVCRNPECPGVVWYATGEERDKVVKYYDEHPPRRPGRPRNEPPEGTAVPAPEPDDKPRESWWEKLI